MTEYMHINLFFCDTILVMFDLLQAFLSNENRKIQHKYAKNKKNNQSKSFFKIFIQMNHMRDGLIWCSTVSEE